ncbi:MAG: winged helix DNA-binding protein [Caulobacter sp.]|nr:winged helix DNA-binding protein [Caulobacter sp.]
MTDQPWSDAVVLPALLRHARKTYGRAMREALAREGFDDIPANGLYILGGLALGAEGAPISRLVGELGITRQGAGQLVDTLVTRGYLARTPDHRDRRQLIITLTERGRRCAEIQATARDAIDARLLSVVGEADVAATRRTLAALVDIDRARAAEKADPA